MSKTKTVKKAPKKSPQKTEKQAAPAAEQKPEQVVLIPLNKITPSPTNPRKSFNQAELDELALSIQNQGLIQPIIIRPAGKDKYEIIAGERRYKACKQAGLNEVKCIIRELDDNQVIEAQLVENLQRADVDPIEEGQGYMQLYSLGKTLKEIATAVGKSDEYVSRRIKLKDLIPTVQKALREGKILLEHAKHICRLQDKDQKSALDYALGWNHPSPALLKEYIECNFMLEVNKAAFDKTGCKECPNRTSCNPSLFADIKKDYCTNAACYNTKMENHITGLIKELEKEKQKFVFVSDRFYTGDSKLFGTEDYKHIGRDKKKCASAIPAIFKDGDLRGKLVTVCMDKDCKTHWPRPKTYGGGPVKKNTQDPDARYHRKIEIISEKERTDLIKDTLPAVSSINFLNDDIKRAIAKKIYRALQNRKEFLNEKNIQYKDTYWRLGEKEFDAWIDQPLAGINLDGIIIELAMYIDISFHPDGILRHEACNTLINFAKTHLLNYNQIIASASEAFTPQKDKVLKSFIKNNGRDPEPKVEPEQAEEDEEMMPDEDMEDFEYEETEDEE